MALSDYLTSDEWDACFYALLGSVGEKNNCRLGDTMRDLISQLLASGYTFEGLDDNGQKLSQIHGTGNPRKMVWMVCGGATPEEVLTCLENGRNFLKIHLPAVIDETDEQWLEQMKRARGQE
jgi:hypothetical protein